MLSFGIDAGYICGFKKQSMIDNWEDYFTEIDKLPLPELEIKIKEQYAAFQKSDRRRSDELDECLKQRKYLINNDFVFTPEVVWHIERINRILIEGTTRVLQRTIQLYRQMEQLKVQGDDFLNDFEVEGYVSIPYDEESLLTLNEDENNGQSDYGAMAEILDYTNGAFEQLRSFTLFGGEIKNRATSDEALVTDDTLQLNWNIELLAAPELKHIPYFCYASHLLFVDSNYSISDAIRIGYFCNEVKVLYQNYLK